MNIALSRVYQCQNRPSPASAHVSRGPGMATTPEQADLPVPTMPASRGRPGSAAGAPALLAHQTLGALHCGGLWRSAPGRTVGGSRPTGRRVARLFVMVYPCLYRRCRRHLMGSRAATSVRVRGRSRRQPRPLASGSPRGLPGRLRAGHAEDPGPGAASRSAVEHGIAKALGDFQVAGSRPVIDSVPAPLQPLFPSLFRKQDDSGQCPRSDH